ncbi:MAG: ribonuclease J [Magnetococcus sp. WYHC-3]
MSPPPRNPPPPPLRLVALGGLGEIGMNLMVYEYDGQFLMVDCGLTFPTIDTPGVDVILPDTQFLEEHADRVVGLVLTHGHEDHIGAIPYIWPRFHCPIYGTPMTLGILEGKLREHDLLDHAPLRQVLPRQKSQIGPFSVLFIQVTHSIIDGVSLAITTPVGTVVHTGDFKIDHTPVDGRPTDLYTLAHLGEQGVLALLSDSTNVKKPGASLSESSIRAALEEVFPQAQGLLIVATFSSNIQRIQQVMDVAAVCGRKVLLNGRSMINNVAVARQLGYLRVPPDTLIDLRQLKDLPRHKVLVLSTGSQGEHNSSLVRIALGEHKEIQVQPGDMVVLSSKQIPGNERAIESLINLLFRGGVRVVHEDVSEVHVSGHGSQEDLRLMLALTRPRFFIPIHGEIQHLTLHAELAVGMGLAKNNVLVVENGQRVELGPDSIRILDQVPHGRMFVDGKGVGDVGDIVLRDRRHLAEDGMVVVVMVVASHTGELLQGPELLTRGVMYEDGNQNLLEQAKDSVLQALKAGPKAMDFGEDENVGPEDLAIRALRRFFKKRLGRRPVVLPLVVEM